MGTNNPKKWDKAMVERWTDAVNGMRASAPLKELRAITMALPGRMTAMEGAEDQKIGYMQSDIGVAYLLTMLTRDLSRQHHHPMKALDIGTFCGLSAGALARGMEENGGKVVTCDVTDAYKSLAEKYWRDEGIAGRVEQHILPLGGKGEGGARELLDGLAKNPNEIGTFDIAFIDGDKLDYAHNYEMALHLLRPGGKIVLDNMIWSGRVADPDCRDARTDALRDLTLSILRDPRVDAMLLNAEDGLIIAEKKGFIRGGPTA